MVVIFRLQGLDGEATEPIVDQLEEDREEVDPEKEYGFCSILAECGGLAAMLRQLGQVADFDAQGELVGYLLRLFAHACKIRVNRRALLELKAVDTMLSVLRMAFSQTRASYVKAAQSLLLLIGQVVTEYAVMLEEHHPATAQPVASSAAFVTSTAAGPAAQQAKSQPQQSHVAMVLERLTTPAVRRTPKVVEAITRILPFLTYGEPASMEALVSHFMGYLNFDEYDAGKHRDELHRFHLSAFVSIAQAIRNDDVGTKLKQFIFDQGVTARCAAYVMAHLPVPSEDESTEPAVTPGFPQALALLMGLASAHLATLRYLHQLSGFIGAMHSIEGLSHKERVGNMAESILEAFCASGVQELADAVRDVRDATRRKKRELAEKRRQDMLREMGFQQKAGTSTVLASCVDAVKGAEALEEEHFTCTVCREGYGYKREEPLCAYVFQKRVPLSPLGAAGLGGSSEHDQGFTTVTAFNLIHLQCHHDATQADSQLKKPREEWEGAALRNSGISCNNLLPLAAECLPEENYRRSLEKFWQYQGRVGRVEGLRSRLLGHDLRMLLSRFAEGRSFSADCHGGGRETNLRLIPFLISTLIETLDARDGRERRQLEKAMTKFITMPDEIFARQLASPASAAQQSDSVFYFGALSLALMSREEWRRHRLIFAKRALLYFHAIREIVPHDEAASPETAAATPFQKLRPAVLFVALVDLLNDTLKPKTVGTPETPPADSETIFWHQPGGPFTRPYRHELRAENRSLHDQLADRILQPLNGDLSDAASFQELFDIMGVLQEVLQDQARLPPLAPAPADPCDGWVGQLMATIPSDDA
ncbi:putative Auxin transport protein BIG [Paratrimastix pyriformis]|uniref:Auxin transport protein BIG n=1 Tax=Paratrimastix pyriformis TaxID=342808 RepID=A0ABQ8UE97_9EUKA|nr:putative Auxin transport protein BIG [Paratrimastix pyriformis]